MDGRLDLLSGCCRRPDLVPHPDKASLKPGDILPGHVSKDALSADRCRRLSAPMCIVDSDISRICVEVSARHLLPGGRTAVEDVSTSSFREGRQLQVRGEQVRDIE